MIDIIAYGLALYRGYQAVGSGMGEALVAELKAAPTLVEAHKKLNLLIAGMNCVYEREMAERAQDQQSLKQVLERVNVELETPAQWRDSLIFPPTPQYSTGRGGRLGSLSVEERAFREATNPDAPLLKAAKKVREETQLPWRRK